MNRRGGILLEVLFAITLFVVAALAILQATGQAARSVDRAAVLQRAVDMATTRMAELEVGLISVGDLRSMDDFVRPEFGAFDDGPAETRLRIEASTERSPHDGLTLVELKVLDAEEPAADGGARIVFTLRQLVRLREGPTEVYESDDMLEGLPDDGSTGFGGAP